MDEVAPIATKSSGLVYSITEANSLVIITSWIDVSRDYLSGIRTHIISVVLLCRSTTDPQDM